MYSEQTFPVLDCYLALLRNSYDTTVESVDFGKRCEEVRRRINAWVEEVTESKIKDLLPDDSVDAETTLIVISAVYFKGTWESPFSPSSTRPHEFSPGFEDQEESNHDEAEKRLHDGPSRRFSGESLWKSPTVVARPPWSSFCPTSTKDYRNSRKA
ncbi:hypothetical protein MTO96_011178 [Rhipicephalus appendiculatus]